MPTDDPRVSSRWPTTQRARHVVTWILAILVGLPLAVSVVLHFWTTSDLWLDEALTVNIAGQPIHTLPALLRRDGAPPLFYTLLHFWMGWFGSSDFAVRALPGVVSLVTIPVAWLAGRRLGGRVTAWSACLLVTTSPFAIRYSTETRMYSLMVLLTGLGFLALARVLEHPRVGNFIALSIVTGSLLYTHYWSLYLVAGTAAWLGFNVARRRRRAYPGTRTGLVALAVGCLTFIPWIPVLLYQSRHTGTPWAGRPGARAIVNAFSSMGGGTIPGGHVLAGILIVLCVVGSVAAHVERRPFKVVLATRPRGRSLAFVVVVTLVMAVSAGYLTDSAYDGRYVSIVFLPYILLASFGLCTIHGRWVRTGVLALAVAIGLGGSLTGVTMQRTQAGQIARALQLHARPGDIIAYCPDQLGPAVSRLLPMGRFTQVTFPRGIGPEFVNWVDYARTVAAGSPEGFAQKLKAIADGRRQIFYVWQPGYGTFGTKCEGILQDLQSDPAFHSHSLVGVTVEHFFEPMWLVRFAPISR